MARLFDDTTPEAEAVLVNLARAASPAAKLKMLDQLNARMTLLLRAGQRGSIGCSRLVRSLLVPERANAMDDVTVTVTFRVTAMLEQLAIPYVVRRLVG